MVKMLSAVHAFQRTREENLAQDLKEIVADFYENSLKYLMYRDWAGFELFFVEILKCESIPGLIQIAHRFDAYLVTLLREVSKRDVLQAVPSEDSTNAHH